MQIFNYDKNTGEFLSVALADQDPLNNGGYLLPANSTSVVPPMIEHNQVACFIDGAWQVINDPRGEYFDADGKQIIIDDLFATPAQGLSRDKPEPTIAQLKQSKRAEINACFEAAIQQITAGYPASETSSWGKQETEARAYVANNSAPTPLIDALASNRSVDKAELVTRIITKADLFAGISGTLIGRRQGLEDDLDALPALATAEDIAAIAW